MPVGVASVQWPNSCARPCVRWNMVTLNVRQTQKNAMWLTTLIKVQQI